MSTTTAGWKAYLPVMEHRQGEGLSLCVCTEVRLKAKRVDGRDEGLDGVEGGAGDGSVLGHMSSVARKSANLSKTQFNNICKQNLLQVITSGAKQALQHLNTFKIHLI